MDITEIENWIAENGPPIAMVSAAGICSAAVAKAGVFYLGRSFTTTQFGIESGALLGVIGVIQGLAPWFLANHIPNRFEDVSFLLSHRAVNVGLVVLTAVAAKAGLIASGMTLFGGLALFGTSYAVNCGIDSMLSGGESND